MVLSESYGSFPIEFHPHIDLAMFFLMRSHVPFALNFLSEEITCIKTISMYKMLA